MLSLFFCVCFLVGCCLFACLLVFLRHLESICIHPDSAGHFDLYFLAGVDKLQYVQVGLASTLYTNFYGPGKSLLSTCQFLVVYLFASWAYL